MRFFCLIFFTPFFFFSAHAQSKTKIFITLQNTNYLRIEQQSIFTKPDKYTLAKIDATHYSLNYFGDKPAILFLNSRQIYIIPGDEVMLNYKVIVWNDVDFKDTISAKGDNAKNYTFSNFVSNLKKAGDVFPQLTDDKYRDNSVALYDDLFKFHALRDKYYTSNLTKYNYDKTFIDYIKRANNLEFLTNAIYFGGELAEHNPKQYPAFSKQLSTAFLNTNFIPADTSYTGGMERTFKAFFYILTHAKFNPVESEKNFYSLLEYIKKYPNPFVKDYFFYFLITDYNDTWKKYRPKEIIPVIQNIKNPAINYALKNYTY